MAGIEFYHQLQQTLLNCGSFQSDRELAALFVDSRLYPWRNRVPQAGSAEARVQATLQALNDQSNAQGENALVLLVQVLQDMKEPMDGCHNRLATLATTLAQNLTSVQGTLSSQEQPMSNKGTQISIGDIGNNFSGNVAGRDIHIYGDAARQQEIAALQSKIAKLEAAREVLEGDDAVIVAQIKVYQTKLAQLGHTAESQGSGQHATGSYIAQADHNSTATVTINR